MRGPADPKNCILWYKRNANYGWSNDQSVLGSVRTPHIRMRVKSVIDRLMCDHFDKALVFAVDNEEFDVIDAVFLV